MTSRILVMPGDGVGPEICREAVRVLDVLAADHGLDIELDEALVGGAAIDVEGDPLPESSLAAAREADAVLFGAIGGPAWDNLERAKRPESGLLRLRSELGLFANLRPAILYPQLAHASALKPDVVSGLDIMIVRELTGGIYFGKPAGTGRTEAGLREAWNTMRYDEAEIERIGRTAFEIARARGHRLCSVDKANVLDVSQLWRDVMNELAGEYDDVELTHMYVDNAAMQLVRAPKQFDTVVTTNLFGDILSDAAAMLTGSIGMLPSASMDANGKGLYEPVHGSAPDIAGQGLANPLAVILSVAMMLRYTLDRGDLADKVEAAVGYALDRGLRTRDIMDDETQIASTQEMGGAIVDMLR
ncbi:3-isopropylmalate dehydrogenase [Salinisphaera hydrothermalis]|uniref:3-isopropylmalate dehydrogenase n=1 Tax=Salinisphaera hydrothermalis (strain C41B8) TaxID=1304275 RepID=A0A084IQ86_SALHC|nr:3-isopropylmalate dehydrogenase [Salinisphaera hydrothermalis]KEZ78870.1 3-isopropylmalate dehydrogenase [Salinisphaera hydrothermalis C41B8]